MKLLRRDFLTLGAGALAASALPRLAFALDYPTRPTRIIAGFAAGGGVDITARLIGQWLADHLGQPFVVENRTGAGGNIGTEAVVNSAADGYTLLLATVPNAVNASLYDNLKFNFVRDIAPVAAVIRVPMVVLVHPSVPAKTIPEFIAYAKANPGKINMASAGSGSAPHMAGELFKMITGVDMVHVPYRGQGPAMTDLLGGQVQILFAAAPGTAEYVRTNKLRALAVTTAARMPDLPEVPSVGDFVAGLRSQPVVRLRRAEEHAGRNRRQAQQGNQCRDGRSRHESQARRDRRRDHAGIAGRVRQVDRRRDRQVGQGGPHRRHQAGIAVPASSLVTPPLGRPSSVRGSSPAA